VVEVHRALNENEAPFCCAAGFGSMGRSNFDCANRPLLFFRKYFDIEDAPYGCPEGVGLPRRPMLPHRSGFEGSGDVRRKRTRLRVHERNQPSQPFCVSDSTVSKGLHVSAPQSFKQW
jgi:hypothetical protein